MLELRWNLCIAFIGKYAAKCYFVERFSRSSEYRVREAAMQIYVQLVFLFFSSMYV